MVGGRSRRRGAFVRGATSRFGGRACLVSGLRYVVTGDHQLFGGRGDRLHTFVDLGCADTHLRGLDDLFDDADREFDHSVHVSCCLVLQAPRQTLELLVDVVVSPTDTVESTGEQIIDGARKGLGRRAGIGDFGLGNLDGLIGGGAAATEHAQSFVMSNRPLGPTRREGALPAVPSQPWCCPRRSLSVRSPA